MTTELKCGPDIIARVERTNDKEIFGILESTRGNWKYEAVWDKATGRVLRFPTVPSENPVVNHQPIWDIRPEELSKIPAFDPSKPCMLSDGRKVHIVSTDYNPIGATKPVIAFQIIGSSQLYTAEPITGVWHQSNSRRLVNSQIVEFRLEADGNTERLKPNIRATFDGNGALVTVEKIK